MMLPGVLYSCFQNACDQYSSESKEEASRILDEIRRTFLKMLELLERPVPENHTRIRWQDSSGTWLHDDYMELEPGALDALKERLAKSTYDRNDAPGGVGRSLLSHMFNLFSQIHVSSSSQSSCGTGDEINSTGRNAWVPHVSLDMEPAASRKNTLHLLTCLERGWYHVQLHQEALPLVMDNKELFQVLQRIYDEHKKKFASFWYLRRVVSIHFVKFLHRDDGSVDVRHHGEICEIGRPCKCIPPIDPANPYPEYEYYPVPPKLAPPIGSDLLVSMFRRPEKLEAGHTWVLEELPKRAHGELKPRDGPPREAWGVYLKEGWDESKMWCFVGFGAFLPSLLFAIFWAVFKDDVEGAFSIAGWWVAGVAIVVGVMSTKTMQVL